MTTAQLSQDIAAMVAAIARHKYVMARLAEANAKLAKACGEKRNDN